MIGYIIKYINLFLFGIIMISKEGFVYADRKITFDSKHITYLLLLYLLIGCWTLFLNNKNQIKALIITDLVLTIILLGDMVYLRYYSQYLTVQLIPLLKNSQTNIKDSVIALFKLKDFLLFINIPFSILFYFIIRKGYKGNNSYKIVNLVSAMLIAFVAISKINIRITDSKEILIHTWDLKSIADNFGLPYYHFNDIRIATKDIIDKKKLNDSELQNIESNFDESIQVVNMSEKGKLKGVAKDKSVIMIQVEALQNFVIGLEVNGKEVTPNMNKLVKESLYFSSVYAQTAGGNTSDAEFMANTSLYPLPIGAVYFSNPNNKYNALPKILNNEGYFTAAMHGFTNTYWNRETVYNSFGFNKFYYNTSYTHDKIVGWGINDKDFFIESINILKDSPKPFYSFMVTLSSHHPFGHFNEENRVDTGEFEETQINSYLEDIAFLDESIGVLVDKLKEEGLYDDTVIVIYGDHRGLRDDKNEELSSFLGKENNVITVYRDFTKTPLIIKLPNSMHHEEVKTIGGQIDILPTLLNIMGIDNKYMMGKNLLSANDNMAIFRNGSFLTNDYLYDNDEEVAYELNSGSEVNKKDIKDLIDKVNKTLETSDLILKYDALPKLGKEDKH